MNRCFSKDRGSTSRRKDAQHHCSLQKHQDHNKLPLPFHQDAAALVWTRLHPPKHIWQLVPHDETLRTMIRMTFSGRFQLCPHDRINLLVWLMDWWVISTTGMLGQRVWLSLTFSLPCAACNTSGLCQQEDRYQKCPLDLEPDREPRSTSYV